jgi:hypothetical protein
MSRLFDTLDLDIDDFALEPVRIVDEDLDEWYERTRNPLGLGSEDLALAGWENDPAGLFHPKWGVAPFFVATQVEASKVGLCQNPIFVDTMEF